MTLYTAETMIIPTIGVYYMLLSTVLIKKAKKQLTVFIQRILVHRQLKASQNKWMQKERMACHS